MGAHLHRQPRGWSPCVQQPGDSCQLLQSYFAEDQIKTNQSAQITLTQRKMSQVTAVRASDMLLALSEQSRIGFFVVQPWQHCKSIRLLLIQRLEIYDFLRTFTQRGADRCEHKNSNKGSHIVQYKGCDLSVNMFARGRMFV